MFPQRLRALREGLQLEQKELAAHLGLAASAISNYESGKRTPGFEILTQICRYFGVSSDWLLGLPHAPMVNGEMGWAQHKVLASLREIPEETVPPGVRIGIILGLVREHQPQLLPVQRYELLMGTSRETADRILAGDFTAQGSTIYLVSRFTGVPEEWIRTGDPAVLTNAPDPGYLELVGRLAQRRISPQQVLRLLDAIESLTREE